MWNTYVTTNTRNTQKKIHNRTYFNKEKLDFLNKYTKKSFLVDLKIHVRTQKIKIGDFYQLPNQLLISLQNAKILAFIPIYPDESYL